MITEVGAAILLETTQCAFRNQSQSKQRSALGYLHLGWVGIINMIRLAHERYQITKGMDSILFLRTFIDYFISSMLSSIYLLSDSKGFFKCYFLCEIKKLL